MKEHEKTIHGWTGQESYCDYARWWDCSFWCSNNKECFKGKKMPTERACPMKTPVYSRCKEKIK